MKEIVYSLLLLCCLLNPCKSMALNVNELRESVPAYWLHHYTSQQEGNIRAPVFIPQVEQLPILKVKLHQLSEEVLNDSYSTINLQHLNYNSLIDFGFSYRTAIKERVGRPYNIGVFENIWRDELTLETEYAEKQNSSLGETIKYYQHVFNDLIDDAMISAIPYKAWIITPYLNVKPGTYEYGEPAQFDNLTGVGGYSINFWPAIRNIPVIMGHDLAYEGRNETVLQERLSVSSELSVGSHFSEDLWNFRGLMIWKETGVYSEDFELCSFQKVEETLKEFIQVGKIKDVFSIALGYVIYADPTVEYKKDDEAVCAQEFVAIPTWVVEAIYIENPNRDFSAFPPSGDPTVYTYSSHVGYKRLNISAQTGKLYDPSDMAKDRVYSKDDWME